MEKLNPLEFVNRLPGETKKDATKRVRAAFRSLLERQGEVSTEIIDGIAMFYSSSKIENGIITVLWGITERNLSEFEQACEMFWNDAQQYYQKSEHERFKQYSASVEMQETGLLEEKWDNQGKKLLAKKNRPLKTR